MTLTYQDVDAVNDLFEHIDRHCLDGAARTADHYGLLPHREIHLTIGLRSIVDLSVPDHKLADNLRSIVRKAWEQGFELEHDTVIGGDYVVLLRRGVFHVGIVGPAAVADDPRPLLSFEPQEVMA